MKGMEVGVRKVEMWELENWSMRLRYLYTHVQSVSLKRSSQSQYIGRQKAVKEHLRQVCTVSELGKGKERIHSTTPPPRLINDIEATMHNKGIHSSGLRAEACGAISACFRGAEFELEEGRVAGVDYGEVV